MAEHPDEEPQAAMVEDDDNDELVNTAYKPPKPATLEEILQKDQDDESLKKYKEKLLGDGAGEGIVVFPENPKRVIVNKLALLIDGRPDMELDLSGDLTQLKKQTFALKEKCQYRIRIYFYVQREIVTGLRYMQTTYRKGIKVDKDQFMVGSYAPKMEMHSYTTPIEDAPGGMIARGTYNIKSLFTDDDKNEHLKWEWSLEIKKDWD